MNDESYLVSDEEKARLEMKHYLAATALKRDWRLEKVREEKLIRLAKDIYLSRVWSGYYLANQGAVEFLHIDYCKEYPCKDCWCSLVCKDFNLKRLPNILPRVY